jgi:hypothetical protein
MLTALQKTSILYQAQVWLSELTPELIDKAEYSQNCDCEYLKAFEILNYEAVLLDSDVDNNLTQKEQEYIYICIQEALNIQNYPVAPLALTDIEDVTIQNGEPGPTGPPGPAGTNGTDANINVEAAPGETVIEVTETLVGGVKTFQVKYAPYVAPSLNVSLDEAAIPDPHQTHIVEQGNVIATLQMFIALDKGKNDVTTSVLTSPGSLAASYAGLLNLTTLNASGSQNITVIATNVSVNTTFSANISDGVQSDSDSSSVTFVYPFLYGNSVGTSITHYTDLTKLIQTKANKVIIFAGTVQYFWFGYPSSYGDLVQIIDQNGFDVTSGWTKITGVTVNSSGLTNNWSHTYIFYRSTSATTINGSHTFKFS